VIHFLIFPQVTHEMKEISLRDIKCFYCYIDFVCTLFLKGKYSKCVRNILFFDDRMVSPG
jgi:hypothetical protein